MKTFYCKCGEQIEIYCRKHPEGAVLRYLCPCCGPLDSRTGLPYKLEKAQERIANAKKHNEKNH